MIPDEPWPLPAGWHWNRFDQVARVASNLVSPADFMDWPHIAPNHIQSGTGRLLPHSTIRQDRVTSPKHRFFAGQVLYSKIRPYLAKVVVPEFDGLCSADMYPIESELEPRFLKWWMLTREFTRRAAGEQARTVLPKINVKSLAGLPIPVASLAEQLSVIAAIEGYFSRLDAAIDTLRDSQQRIPGLARSLIDSSVNGNVLNGIDSALDSGQWSVARSHSWRNSGSKRPAPNCTRADLGFGSPEGPWPIQSLESVTDPVRVIRYGILKPRVGDAAGTVPYVEVKDLQGNSLIGKHLRRTSTELDEEFAGARLQGGDVVMAVRGSYERSAVVPAELLDANMSRDVARIAPLPQLRPEYLNAWLQCSFARQYFSRHARGVAVKGVNISALRALPIAVPSIDTQELLVKLLDDQLLLLARIEKEAENAVRRGEGLKRALLAAAFSGQLTKTMSIGTRREAVRG